MSGALGKKIGPVPVWVIAIVGGLGVAYYLRKQSAANAAATDATATDTSSTYDPGTTVSGTDGGTVGALGDPNAVAGGFQDTSGNEAAIGSLYDQVGSLAASITDLEGVVSEGFSSPFSDGSQAPNPTTTPAPTGGDGAGTSTGTAVHRTVKPSTGIVSSKTLKNGATLTTFADGRIEEKVPGKPAYIVKKPDRSKSRLATPHMLYIADAPVGYGAGIVSPGSSAPISLMVASSGPSANGALVQPPPPGWTPEALDPTLAAPTSSGAKALTPETVDPNLAAPVASGSHSVAVLPAVYDPQTIPRTGTSVAV